MAKKLNVFISSTYEDLKDYRNVAHYAILQVGWVPVFMEIFGAMPGYTVEACLEKLKTCDLMVMLVAFRRGWVPREDQKGNGVDSITALEYRYAHENNIPVLVFMAEPTWPGNKWERDPAAMDFVEKFRSELDQCADKFEYEDPAGKESVILPIFRSKVVNSLVNYKDSIPDIKPVADDRGNFQGASKRLLSGKCIPFLGPGVYGSGPLSVCALRDALGDQSCQSCDNSHESCQKSSLATTAEFLESPGRDLFLEDLKTIIEEQAEKAELPSVYDLVLQIKPPPPFIVSTTLDLLLEKKLHQKNPRCLILCHAIRSKDLPKGILVFNGPLDDTPQLCPASEIPTKLINLAAEEKLAPEERGYIVYKPFGSPLLVPKRIVYDPSGSDPEVFASEGVDTVVITEEDYQILLRLLGPPETGVPGSFTVCLRNCPPIFLGYPMDAWHYRLVGQFFKSIYPKDMMQPFAVRQASLDLEKKAWKGLGVDLVSMEVNEFFEEIKKTQKKGGVVP